MSDIDDLDKDLEYPAQVDNNSREVFDHGGPHASLARIGYLLNFFPHDEEKMKNAVNDFYAESNRNGVLLQGYETRVPLSADRLDHPPSTTTQSHNGNSQLSSTVANSVDNNCSVSTGHHHNCQPGLPEMNALPIPVPHYQHGSIAPFDRTQWVTPYPAHVNAWPPGFPALLDHLLQQAQYPMGDHFEASIQQAYIMVGREVGNLIHTRNYERIVQQSRNVFIQFIELATQQWKAYAHFFVINICHNREGARFGKAWQDEAEIRGIRFFQDTADREYNRALRKFDVEIGIFVTRKLVDLQAAIARAEAYATRPPQKRQARGFQNPPAYASQDVTSTVTVPTPTNSQNTTSTTSAANPQYSRVQALPLPLELQLMVLKEATPSRLVLWNAGDLPPIVEALPLCRRLHLEKNPPKIFMNHDGTYTKIHATGEDLVYITGKFLALKRSFADVAVVAPTQIISRYTPSINGTPAGPICISPLLTIIAFPVHDAYHYFRHGGRQKADFNWRVIRKIFPILVKMVFICGWNIPSQGTPLSDMETKPLNQLGAIEQDSVNKIIFGYDRAHGSGFIQDLVFEQVVFKGNGN